MSTSNKCLLIPLCIIILLPVLIVSIVALDTITANQTITDGDTIISSGGRFELGFFSPGSSKNRYVGIWYNKINVTKNPVWVANRETPLTDFLGFLKVSKTRTLVLFNSTSYEIWSSNVLGSVQNPVAQLLDTGNLVIKNTGEDDPGNFLWQSFDYPGNTLLEGMKLGKNFVTGHEWQLMSWKNEDDPSPGDYTYKIDTHGYPQLIMLKCGNLSFRVGPWIGDRFSGLSKIDHQNSFQRQRKFTFSKVEVNYSYVTSDIMSLPTRVLSPSGAMQWRTWDERQANWITSSSGSFPTDVCDNYNSCGAYGRCNVGHDPKCVCLDKFVAKYPTEYNASNRSDGCVRRIPLDCEKGDEFIKYSGIKLPDTRNAWFNMSMSLEECRVMCLGKCSCTAYSNSIVDGDNKQGSGCFLWFEDLMDLRSVVNGENIYIRMASSELGIDFWNFNTYHILVS